MVGVTLASVPRFKRVLGYVVSIRHLSCGLRACAH